MATRATRCWPFDDARQIRLMASSFGWPQDETWVTRFAARPVLRWATDPGWGTDPGWAAGLRVRTPGFPVVNAGQAGSLTVSLGYHPDLPDRRDFPYEKLRSGKVKGSGAEKLGQARIARQLGELAIKGAAPKKVNSIPWCSPIEDQGALGSCTAQAVVGLVEYLQRRSGSQYVDGSRLFVYKVSRKLLGWTGDTGAYLRTAMKAVATFGVPPEAHWPYVVDMFEEEPSAFLYSFASNYQALGYARLDPPGADGKQVLAKVKEALASRLGVVFGFPVYSCVDASGEMPFPTDKDRLLGGHAVLAVGYDDDHGKKGALIVRNSWGATWGYGGYGFLPYEYVEEGLAQDFWTITKSEWLDLAAFE